MFFGYSKDFFKINARYAVGLDAKYRKKTPSEWISSIKWENCVPPQDSNWRIKEILSWFDQYGIEFFEPLEIWHIKKLREEFLKKMGREPKPYLFSPVVKLIVWMRWKAERLKNMFRNRILQ